MARGIHQEAGAGDMPRRRIISGRHNPHARTRRRARTITRSEDVEDVQ